MCYYGYGYVRLDCGNKKMGMRMGSYHQEMAQNEKHEPKTKYPSNDALQSLIPLLSCETGDTD
jgi:hypothetical protein